jgi:hypothetical protein
MRPRYVGGPKLCNRCSKRPAPSNNLTKKEANNLLVLYRRQASTMDNNIVSIPTSGRPIHLLQLPMPTVPSSAASERTKRERSAIINQVFDVISSKPKRARAQQEDDVVHQMAQWIKKPRTLRLLRTACSISSVRFVGQLTVVAGVVLKASGMTWSHMRFFRSFFNKLAHWNGILPSEPRIREKIAPYELIHHLWISQKLDGFIWSLHHYGQQLNH